MELNHDERCVHVLNLKAANIQRSKSMKNLIKYSLLLMVFCFAFSNVASAGNIVVVVNPSNSLSSATADEISKVFRGKTSSVAGASVEPVDQSPDAQARIDFSEKILGRSVNKVVDYWQKRVFAGKGDPPKSVDNDANVIAFVKGNPNAIGYISAGSVSGDVKVIEVDGKKEW
jgi:ABC-type phosphate transport system substrate-binding protein